MPRTAILLLTATLAAPAAVIVPRPMPGSAEALLESTQEALAGAALHRSTSGELDFTLGRKQQNGVRYLSVAPLDSSPYSLLNLRYRAVDRTSVIPEAADFGVSAAARALAVEETYRRHASETMPLSVAGSPQPGIVSNDCVIELADASGLFAHAESKMPPVWHWDSQPEPEYATPLVPWNPTAMTPGDDCLTPIPEPSAGLLAIAGIILLWLGRRSR